MAMTPEQRRLRARVAAQSRWASRTEAERRAETQAARDGFTARFAAAPDPDRALRAHMNRLALKSSRARGSNPAA